MIKLNAKVKLTKPLKAKDSGVLYSLPQGLVGIVKEVITETEYRVEFATIEAVFTLNYGELELV